MAIESSITIRVIVPNYIAVKQQFTLHCLIPTPNSLSNKVANYLEPSDFVKF